MSHDNGRQEQEALRASAEAANARAKAAEDKAATPDPMEARRRDYIGKLDDWRMGKDGPIDVLNMPGGGVGMSLFREAKSARDSGRIGRGMATLSDGANPNFAASLGQEMDLERGINASGALEDHVDTTLAGVDGEMYGLAGMGNSRNMNIAQMDQNAYQNAQGNFMQYLMRPKQPSFLKQLALGLAGSASFSKGALTI
jgi:hypothetical protein